MLLPELPDCSLLPCLSQETLLKPVFFFFFQYKVFSLPPPLMQYTTMMAFLRHWKYSRQPCVCEQCLSWICRCDYTGSVVVQCIILSSHPVFLQKSWNLPFVLLHLLQCQDYPLWKWWPRFPGLFLGETPPGPSGTAYREAGGGQEEIS